MKLNEEKNSYIHHHYINRCCFPGQEIVAKVQHFITRQTKADNGARIGDGYTSEGAIDEGGCEGLKYVYRMS
jgi:hypothetical protein